MVFIYIDRPILSTQEQVKTTTHQILPPQEVESGYFN